jgi:asparagine synthase (glutamine-hydrolysing)
MCGIAGLICKSGQDEEQFGTFFEASKLLNHRGPDYSNSFIYKNCLIIHYRLSILDPDPRSNQPFHSSSHKHVCTYNGEIYNFKELKQKYNLETVTTSDTEVMIESFEKIGPDIAKEWNGIFALGIINKNEDKLFLIRDRYGVKPLYIYEDEKYLAFSSESKVLYRWLTGFTLDYQGLTEYLWYGNTISEHTLVKGVRKLSPATVLTVDLAGGVVIGKENYWSLPLNPAKIDDIEPVKDIQYLLEAAVKRQLVSDVPLGVLLSGGIDSSSIVAFASRHIQNLDTYSIEYDFNIGGESELENARMIADKFGTNHHEMKIGSDDITSIFSDLVYQYDDPFADPANVPLYLLAKACRKDKTVILQGDGGDEFFGGYRRYNVLDWLLFWKLSSAIACRFIPSREWSLRMKRISYILNQDDAMKMALYLTEDVPYNSPIKIIDSAFLNQVESKDPFTSYRDFNEKYEKLDIVQRMLYADVDILLNHTYLEKVDKATMFCSLEARVPFLDNDLSDYVLRLPSSYKIRAGQKKYLLRKAMRGIVPDQILDGQKRGFDVPYKQWLANGLYEFARNTFGDLQTGGLLDKTYLITLLSKHKKGEGNYGPLLWKSLVLAHWLHIYKQKIKL